MDILSVALGLLPCLESDNKLNGYINLLKYNYFLVVIYRELM